MVQIINEFDYESYKNKRKYNTIIQHVDVN